FAAVDAGRQVGADGVEQRVHHLAGDGALPDQLVQTRLVGAQISLHLLRQARARSRANGLVRFLRVLRFRLVAARLGGQGLVAITLLDAGAQLAHGFAGQRYRVGAHVGDQAGGFAVQRNALVQRLRRAHGAAGGKAELARGFLLQRRGGERWRRIAPALSLVDLADGELVTGGGAQGGQRLVGSGLV